MSGPTPEQMRADGPAKQDPHPGTRPSPKDDAGSEQPTGGTAFPLRFTAPLMFGSTLNPINSSLIATGLIGIGKDLHAGPAQTASLISVLYLASAVMQPTMGKLATLFGARRVFLVGAAILVAGGVVGTIAPSLAVLLVSRVLIGIGTSAAYPTAMTIVRTRADAAGIDVPGSVLGNLAIASQVTAVIGLPLGGLLVGVFGWRSLFAINVPLAVVTIALTIFGVPKDPPTARQPAGDLVAEIDLPGIGLFAGTIIALLVFLTDLSQPRWWLLPVFAVLAAALYFWEGRSRSPLIDFAGLGSNPPLLRTYLRQILTYLGAYAFLYGFSQWMEQSAGLNATLVGVILIPLSGLSIVLSRIISRRGWVRSPLIIAGVFLILTAAAMLFVDSNSSIIVLIGLSLLLGVTNGFTGVGNQAALYSQADADHLAVASGLFRTSMYFGAIFSSSLIGITFGSSATDHGFHLLGWVVGVLGVAMTLVTILDRRIPVKTQS